MTAKNYSTLTFVLTIPSVIYKSVER